MSQLQDMQITSPGYHPNMQSSPLPSHATSRPMMIGSVPNEHMSHYNNGRFFNNTSSPVPTSHGSVSEYSTPASTWSNMHHNVNPLMVNTSHQQQHLIPGSAPSGGYPDLIMEDISMQVRLLFAINL